MLSDVTVIGAGPAGCTAAREIARHGYTVTLLEEHSRAGEPVRCAGLVSPRAFKLSGVSGTVILNRITGAQVFSPLGGYLQLSGAKEQAVVVDRGAFDQALAAQARRAGAVFIYSARAIGFGRRGDVLVVRYSCDGQEREISTRLLIGADGVNSTVAAWMGREPPAEQVQMFAAEAELPLEPETTNLVRVFLGSSVAPGWFGWIIPISRNRARIGVGVASRSELNVRSAFDRLCAVFPEQFAGLRLLKPTGGAVPLGLVKKSYADGVLLVGDAACQTKPLTGGGIYLGLLAAGISARVAVRALEKGDFSASLLESYQDAWYRKMAEEIRFGMKQRELFTCLNDEQFDAALRFLNRPFWRGFAFRFGDFDYHSWLGKKIWALPSWLNLWRSMEHKAGLGELKGFGGSKSKTKE